MISNMILQYSAKLCYGKVHVACPTNRPNGRDWVMNTEEKFKKALKYAENSIKMKYGSLKDLPPELANTVCNIYFKFCFSSITYLQLT